MIPTTKSLTSQIVEVQIDFDGYKFGKNSYISTISQCADCVIHNLQNAVKLCNGLAHRCGGITKNSKTGEYSLRSGNELLPSNIEDSWLKYFGLLTFVSKLKDKQFFQRTMNFAIKKRVQFYQLI